MKAIYIFLILYVIIFLIDYLILKNLGKYKINEYAYMQKRFKLKNKKSKYINLITSFINSFIMSIVCFVAIYFNLPLYISLPMSFILLFILIYFLYGIYGKILKKKQKNKNLSI